MPWPRRPYELLRPSPDLLARTPRRSDVEIAPAEKGAVNDLRWAVVTRLTAISRNHVSAAWQQRYKRPVSPVLLVLLFAVPFVDRSGTVVRYELRADVRSWHLTDKAADPADVLRRLADQVYQGWRNPTFDVYEELINQPDERWRPGEQQSGTEFVGVALSTLDTTYGQWDRAQRKAADAADVPAEAFVQLSDGGRLRILSHAGHLYHRVDRWASVSLNLDGKPPLMRWDFASNLNSVPHSDDRAYTWHYLAELTRVLYWGLPSWR